MPHMCVLAVLIFLHFKVQVVPPTLLGGLGASGSNMYGANVLRCTNQIIHSLHLGSRKDRTVSLLGLRRRNLVVEG